jgi:hypothetical protein
MYAAFSSVACLVIGEMLVATTPMVFILLLAIVALAAFLFAPTPFALGMSVLTFALFQISDAHPIHLGSISIYTTDILLCLLILRGIRPIERAPASNSLGRFVHATFAIWFLMMAVGAIHGIHDETSLATVLRRFSPVVLYPGFVFGFTRLLREESRRNKDALSAAGYVVAGLIGWMLMMRVVGHHFEHVNHLGKVVLSNGELVRRDYGFATAFIVYPAAAVYAAAAYVGDEKKRFRLMGFIVLCVAATLLTLIRGEIFGLVAGLFAVFVFSKSPVGHSTRRAPLLAFGGATVFVAAILLAVGNPSLGRAITERSLPGATESSYARATARYRLEALDAGISTARTHKSGLGFMSDTDLAARRIDPGFVAHSAPAWLLVFTGWPGAISGLACVVALAVRGLRDCRVRRFAGTAFVGVLAMMTLYSLSASGIVGQPWVIGLFALAIALFRETA